MILCQTIVFSKDQSFSGYKFQLPTHKGNKQYQGNEIIIQECSSEIDPLTMFTEYMQNVMHDFHFCPNCGCERMGLGQNAHGSYSSCYVIFLQPSLHTP